MTGQRAFASIHARDGVRPPFATAFEPTAVNPGFVALSIRADSTDLEWWSGGERVQRFRQDSPEVVLYLSLNVADAVAAALNTALDNPVTRRTA
jgi:hypothetical protein